MAERRGVLPLEKGKANEVCEGIVVPDQGANLAIGTIATSNPLPRFCGKKKARANKLALAFFPLAERRGFEPPIAFTILAFQAGTLDHSDTSPFLGPHSIV